VQFGLGHLGNAVFLGDVGALGEGVRSGKICFLSELLLALGKNIFPTRLADQRFVFKESQFN
jgi:hypothetical protein